MFRLGKITCGIFIVFFLIGIVQSKASYITKKSDTTKEIEKIEKSYANGSITKLECTKKKSKVLKLKKVSKTICDNVEVKVVKKESKKEKKVEYIKKKKKKKIKAKKEFLKKTKDLSKKAKSWITKKVKKEKKHYKTIAQLPKSDFYFTATDGKGNTYIGYINGDENSKTIKIKTEKFKKIYNGKAFQDDKKTQCNVDSVIDKIKNIYTRQIIVKCPENTFFGYIHQSGNQGYGVAQSNTGISLDFTFSINRNAAVASLKKKKRESKKVKKIAKLEEKNIESKDMIKPVIKINYNNKTFEAQGTNEMVMEISKDSYQIKGIVTDIGGSIEALRVDGRTCKPKRGCNLKDDGSFVIDRKNRGDDEEIWLTAYDAGGLGTDFVINVKVLTITGNINDNIPKENYYALLIGNQNYDTWDDLDTPINDVVEIGRILKTKYKFKEVVVLKDAKKSELDEAFWKMNDKLTNQDNLLIYYAGHGKKVESLKKAFWIPVDAKNLTERGRYWYNTDLVTAHLGTIKAKHILLVSDSCFAGIYGKKRGNENIEADTERDPESAAYFRLMLSRVARIYLASGGDKPVYDGMGGKHSIFAKYFIKVLKENKTTIDSLEVFHKARKGVEGTVRQSPEYNYINELEHAKGEFVFTARN